MNSNQQESINKIKSNKTLESIISKSKLTFFSKIINIFQCIQKIIVWVINKLDEIITNCSVLTQFTITLIPFSIVATILIFIVHYIFYQNLYLFNFHKGLKEEFLDHYITEIDDMHAELIGFVTKENYLDVENQLFFEVYYKEMASIGLLNNTNKRIFPNISKYSETMYSQIETDSKDIFTMPQDISKKNIDDRNDSIREFAKLYYYMMPIIIYDSFRSKLFINQTFFITYEFDGNYKKIKGKELFFMLPRNKDSFNQNDNFTPNNYLLNPLVNAGHYDHSPLINNSYYEENWFMKQDNYFRESIDTTKERYSQISLAHLNNEYNGNISKSLIISSQQYIQSNGRHYIINIIFFLCQAFSEKVINEYSTFIIKNNSIIQNNEIEKYSDNESFVILKSDITEYSLSTIDYQYFHYGLYDKNHSFFQNGISFDSFNLDFLYAPLNFYSTVENFEIDLQYLSALYLYKTLFQTLNYSIITKNREEVFLYNFNDDQIVKNICSAINFESYHDYIKKSKINCWDKENSIFYDKEIFQNISMNDINSKYPLCNCIPLYCLENFNDTSKNVNIFENIKLNSEINLPNKCQNKFISNEKEDNINNNRSYINLPSRVYKFLSIFLEKANSDYIKIKIEILNQLPGYYFLIISQIKTSIDLFLYFYYSLITQIEIMVLVFGITFIGSIICMIIMYINLRRYSIIIKEFKKKHELYVFHSEDNSINDDNQKNKNNEKGIEHNINNENMPLLQNEGSDIINTNDNTLLDELFTIFCKHYKLSRKDIEKYYAQQKHETKKQMKIKMMMEKNELFRLLAMFSVIAPFFRLNLSLDYKMYNYTKIIKKYDQYVSQVVNINKEQTRLTQNILYELLSTENISDYGLISNLNFKYISNIKAEFKENCIQHAIFKNVINKMKGKNDDLNESEININDVFLMMKDGDEKQNIKLILKQKNELMDMFKIKFEEDDYINFNKIESSFNFFFD